MVEEVFSLQLFKCWKKTFRKSSLSVQVLVVKDARYILEYQRYSQQ